MQVVKQIKWLKWPYKGESLTFRKNFAENLTQLTFKNNLVFAGTSHLDIID